MARYTASVLRHLPSIVATRSLSHADRAMNERGFSCVVDGIRVTLPPGRFSGAREMYARRVYFPRAGLPFGPGDNVVDLGANVGLFTLLAAAAGARVLAVEAQEGMVPVIEDLARVNGVADNVLVRHAAVGGGVDGVGIGSHAGSAPPAASMVQLLDAAGMARVRFVKCDIEGSEFALVREGAWLDRVDEIAMEVHPDHGSVPDVERTLCSRGFAVTLNDLGYLFASRVRGAT
jgi:hypothetical protein